jgi:phosphatidylglycerophosphatase A
LSSESSGSILRAGIGVRMARHLQKLLLCFVTCAFVGYLPFAPGTFASILAVVILLLLPFPSLAAYILFTLFLVILSVAALNALDLGDADPPYVVIDEFTGMYVAMAGHSPTVASLIIGFILFRIFDILKPYPVKQAEGLKKGYGIVADDVLAGIFANAGVWVCLAVWRVVS